MGKNLCECGCGEYTNKNNRYLHNHHLIGKKQTEETKRKIGLSNKGKKSSFKGKKHSEETKRKMSKQKIGKKHSEETKRKMSKQRKGEKNSFYGKHHTEESKRIIAEKNKLRPFPSEETRKKLSHKKENHPLWGKKHSDESKEKMSDTAKEQYKNGKPVNFKGMKHSDETKKKISDKMKAMWKNAEYRNKMESIIKMLSYNSPNKSEQNLQTLLEDHYPGDWEFVGDGKIIINGKCPDFICEDKKLIIELFGDFWHQGEDINDRIKEFEPNFKTLVIWDSEMRKDKEKVRIKIDNFYKESI